MSDAPEIAQTLLVESFVSALAAANENRIGRQFEDEKNVAYEQLEEIGKLLRTASQAVSNLNPIAKELLARDKLSLLELSNGELDQFFWAGTEIGDTEAIQHHVEQLNSIHQSVEHARSQLEGRFKKFGRGRPALDGALAVAKHCALAFREYVEDPHYPPRGNYGQEYEGRFFKFVEDVFLAGELDAQPEAYTRQAVDFIKLLKPRKSE
ncbi:hypothetical protein [Antarctobacter sp.]|uniref:hypothetical protein n=1 Tax=Antarctobacter sp. TaxID=1872577 RepID=UPI002B2684E2|nr:hypothetical protein [Antarctobacter sp.]